MNKNFGEDIFKAHTPPKHQHARRTMRELFFTSEAFISLSIMASAGVVAGVIFGAWT